MQLIDENVYARIAALSAEGNDLADGGDFAAAIGRFGEALELVPDPKEDWGMSTWLFTAIGDVAFQTGDFERAEEALGRAVLCPGGLDNPFVRLRRGQTFFERGELKKAEEELTAAYTIEGAKIFDDEDPRYFAHLEKVRKR